MSKSKQRISTNEIQTPKMILTKEQTYQLIINNQKANSRRFKPSTKIRWKCLNCQKDIYVSEKAYSVTTIFCSECKPLFFGKETIAQYQYLRMLKDYQLEQLYLVFGKPQPLEPNVYPNV